MTSILLYSLPKNWTLLRGDGLHFVQPRKTGPVFFPERAQIGKLRFTFGYGAGDSDKRIPGLIWSDFLCLLQMRGFLIIALVQHFCF